MVLLQRGLNIEDVVGGDEARLADAIEPGPQGLPVAQNFLRRWAEGASRTEVVLKELVVRGDDVLDLRTVFGLLDRERVDENALLGNGAGNPLQLGQLAAGAGQLFQDCRRLKSGCRKGLKTGDLNIHKATRIENAQLLYTLNAIWKERIPFLSMKAPH